MKSRKLRPVRPGGTTKKAPSDVSPSTSLPPLVEGQLRCFLRVTISRVLWTIHKPPSPSLIRLRWWGESSNGTHFFPRDGSQLSQKSIKTTARFPIRCGPKQFTSYLTDMGSLVLEVVSKPNHLPVARAQVAGISHLSLSHPISGFYTLVSPTSEKLGELQVSLNLEPLTEAYDNSSSGPPKDVSHEGQQGDTQKASSQHKSLSDGSGKESTVSSRKNTPRGKDHLYFQNAQKNKETLENQMPTNKQIAESEEVSRGQSNSDVLSVILERGNKLRDAMVVSALQCDLDSGPALKDSPLPLPKDNIQAPLKFLPPPPPPGMFLKNILQTVSPPKQLHVADLGADSRLSCNADFDNRAIELLLGGSVSPPFPHWDGQHSPPESLSGHSSVCADSELNDPQYDESLLENLFYKTPTLDSKPDNAFEEGKGKSAPSENQQKRPSQFGVTMNKHPHVGSSVDASGAQSLLNEEQLRLLSSVRLLRVTIESLTIPAGSSAPTLKNKGRPPRSLIPKKCTYFVEYVLPATPASSRHKTGDGEVTRAVSSKVKGGVVNFDQTSVFSVNMSSATVQLWLETDMAFKIHSRRSDQKKAVAIGEAFHPLRCLLQNQQLCQSIVLPVQSLEGNKENLKIGPLKVTLEFSADRSLSSLRRKDQVSPRASSPSQTALSPRRETSSRTQHADTGIEESQGHFSISKLNVKTPQKSTKGSSSHPVRLPSPKLWQQQQQQEEDSAVLLHALLMVPDGKDFISGPLQAPNVYLNCKLFWCDETARSVMSWGQANPTFNFAQVTPVTLTSKLLERMRNNMMVIEVWQKTGVSGQDQLLGLVKLPLHQFYMSFRDPKIAHLLLQAQYPVLAVDCYMPVIDVFSGSCRGNLRVVLAMGQSEQIVALQRSRDEESDSFSPLVRPVHLLDHQPHSHTKVNKAQAEVMTEHVFLLKVEKISGLTPLQSTVWGEADCYIQYSFPCQDEDIEELDSTIIESSLNLKPFRTTTTLCVPDPVFGHTETHVLLVPEGLPVQSLLLSSLASQGLSSGGGVQFDVWCRYYYPNVRDQLVARGMLPLSKLCAMVTMQRQQPNDGQRFSLPLIPRTDSSSGDHHQSSGLLDVFVRYKHRPMRLEGKLRRGTASRIVTLVVQVHRASGLKAAARLISEKDQRFSYFVGVGLNTFVTVQLSFLPESERRSTRTAARTFCPEFDHHAEVSCDLLAQRSSGETCSLAEQLEQASAVFTVWNKDNRNALTVPKCKDVMLGKVEVPLTDLVYKRTGISGWFGVYMTQERSSSQQQQHVLVGGLELSVSFAHHCDRERVIKAAQGLAWDIEQRDGVLPDDEESWEESRRKLSLTFSMPRAWIPVHCLFLPGLKELERSTYCYFRYKFYDQEAFCSQMKHPCVEEGHGDGLATASFEGSWTTELRSTQPLIWYLREEKLEVQLWVAFKKDKTKRPSDTDRLVGSAFIDLSSLAKTTKQTLIISGVYPLFRRSAADLQGAALRVHITLTAGCEHKEASAAPGAHVDLESPEELQPEEVEATDGAPPSPRTPSKSHSQSKQLSKSHMEAPDVTSVRHTDINLDESFPVTVIVDQAMHLNLKGCPLAKRSEASPCCCVSYVTADSADPVCTAVVTNTESPVWDHRHECRLSKELLVDPQQSLVFKVWHKGEMERVIGFAPVDLSPLLCGFLSVCGWYNITDFSGQCHGQLKVSVTPLRGILDLREQRRAANEESTNKSSTLFQTAPLIYQTTAAYSSFPAHISRYPEQKISSPERTEKLFSERPSESDRHHEHMDNVRLYHQSLQEQTASRSTDISPSSSMLISTLRKKLGELDNIHKYFSQKLTTPTFSYMTERDGRTKLEEPRNTQGDATQLLLRSSMLVGEVNNIISGLREPHLETIPSKAQSCSVPSPAGDHNPQTVTKSVSVPCRVSDYLTEEVSPFSSPPPDVPEDRTDSEAEEEKDRLSSLVKMSDEENEGSSEPDGEETCRRDEEEADEEEEEEDHEEEEDEKDEDYEEVVLKPRHLNEVTSFTDRTSPWTSVLSDPDLVSLESLEVHTGPDLSEDDDGGEEEEEEEEEKEGRVVDVEAFESGEKLECTCGDESEDSSSDGSEATDGEVTQRTSDKRQDEDEEPSKPVCSPSITQDATDTHNAPGSTNHEDTRPQPCFPMEVPNFFLSSHQLEASMRAIRLAPSFSNTCSDDPGLGPSCGGAVPRRGPRRRPNLSPSSMKKETERIAKIFTAPLDESR